jgi:hypothetical protein
MPRAAQSPTSAESPIDTRVHAASGDCAGHWTDPERYAEDIERLEFLGAQGWLIVRVSGRQLRYQPETVVRRVREALIRRGCPL